MIMKLSRNFIGLRYALTLVVVIGVIILGLNLFHIADGTWALISGVVCTELEVDQVHNVILMRLLSTIVGVVLSTLILILIGPNYWSVIVGVLVTTLTCHYILPLKNSWKLATATGVMVLIAGLQQNSIHVAESLALKRALEVIGGSIVAGVISYAFYGIWTLIGLRKR
jgi:uncharacterized membrane protein YccC